VKAEPFQATCERCGAGVPLTPAEEQARVGPDGSFRCDQCKRDGEHPLADPVAARRFWAGMMVARDLQTFESILAGRPVMERRLDRTALARAFRGQPPPPGAYLVVTLEMLDAVAEGGPFAG
jgi:hypothetical protein